jgi:hypothetical protein
MSFPPPITGLKLRVSTGTDTYEQSITSASLGNNSMQIMPNTVVFNAFNTNPAGTIFTPSIVTSYGSDELGNAVSAVSTPSVVANFVARKITPTLSLAAFTNKSTTDSPFSLSVTTNSTGVLSYLSSAVGVATVNSSGLVTIISPGTTTISVSVAASSDGVYTAAGAVTRQLVVLEKWRQLGADIDGEAANDQSGRSVSISSDGTTLAIGAQFNDGNGTDSGHVRVYKYNPSKTVAQTNQSLPGFGPVGWDRLGADIDGEALSDNSGYSVSLSSDGTILAIGSRKNDGNGSDSGHVRVYKYNSSKTVAQTNQSLPGFGPAGWDRLGADIDGEAASDWSGASVSLSSDGTTLAIGTIYNSGNGTYSGHVRVYKYNPSKTVAQTNQSSAGFGPAGWDRLGADIDGEAVSNYSGYSVSLSSDGTTLAIGAYGNDGNGTDSGHVRVYKYNPSKTVAQTNQSSAGFGPVGWDRLGADIDGEAANDQSGISVSLSSDGTTLAIGASGNDGNGSDSGHVRVYKYNPSKTVAQTNQSSAGFGPVGWDRLGADIDGEAASDWSGASVSLSSDGTTLAIGTIYNSGNGTYSGHVRVYKYNPSKTVAQTNQSLPGFGPVGWYRLGADIDGEAVNDFSGRSVSLSSDGTTLAIGADANDGTTGNTTDNRGHVRVYKLIPTSFGLFTLPTDIQVYRNQTITRVLTPPTSNSSGAFTFTSSNTAVATISVNNGVSSINVIGGGTTTITAIQSASDYYASFSVTASLTVTVILPTLGQFTLPTDIQVYQNQTITRVLTPPTSNSSGAFTFTSSNTAVATISVNNGVSSINVIGAGSTIITAIQAASGDFASRSTTASLTVTVILPTLGPITLQSRELIYQSQTITRQLTPPTSNSSGEFTFTSSNTDVATISISSGVSSINVIGAGSTIITAIQAASGIYASLSSSILLDTINGTTFGTIWRQIGADIDGEAANDSNGRSVSLSSDGSTLAIGAFNNSGNGTYSGHVRVYKYNPSKSVAQLNQSLPGFGPVKWDRLGGDIDGEAANDWSGYSVSLSSDGTTLAIGAPDNDANGSASGHVRVYKYNPDKTVAQLDQSLEGFGPAGWDRLGADIDGEAASDFTGFSVSLSSNGTTLAIGAYGNDGNGSDSGHVRVYKYNSSKLVAQLDQSLPGFGPAGWDRIGADIDGEAANDQSGRSVSLSSDGTTLAIGAIYNDGNGIDSGHVRVYKYNPSKTVAQTNQSLPGFGPVGWDRLGADIDGEAASDYSGTSVSLSSDGTTLAIGADSNDANGSASGHVRVYKYNSSKTVAQTNQSLPGFGPAGWDRIGADIDGEASLDQSGYSVSLSSDGTTLAIGARGNDGNGSNSGHVRVYKYNPSKTVAQTNQSLPGFGPAGWDRLGADIDGEAVNDNSGTSVSLSSDGITLAIGATGNDGNGSNSGHVRVYNINSPTFGPFTLPTDIQVYQNQTITRVLTPPTSNSSGAFTFTSSNTAVATISISGGVSSINIIGPGTTTITAIQAASGGYVSFSVTASLTVTVILPTLGPFTLPTDIQVYQNQTITRVLTPPTSNSSGAFTFTSSNTAVATISVNNGVSSINVIGAGSTIITAIQAASGDFASQSTTASLTVTVILPTLGPITLPSHELIYQSQTITRLITPPTSNSSGTFTFTSSNTDVATISISGGVSSINVIGAGSTIITAIQAASGIYASLSSSILLDTVTGTMLRNIWIQLGADIDGEAANDYSGCSVSLSSDGNTLAIGTYLNNKNGTDSGHVRVYTRDINKTTAVTDQNSSNFGPVGWTRLGGDIDGEAAFDNSGISVSLSSDGTTLAIGAIYNDGNGSDSGHVRVYKYNPDKTYPQLNQSLEGFGPAGWDRLGADIDGEAINDQSGVSVSLSSDGTTLAIGAIFNDGTNGNDSGHVRVYKYNSSKTVAQTNQSLAGFGPAGWDRLGADIDGEATNDYSGVSVSLSPDGTTLAIGAEYNDGNGNDSGHVRVYKYNPDKTDPQLNQSLPGFGPAGWNRLGADIDGEAANDYSGRSVSLSSDGTTLAIAANFNDANGDNSGHVRVYKYNPSKTVAQTNQSLAGFGPAGWDQLGADIDGEAVNDLSGISINLSSDGTTLAIGARGNDGNGSNSGHVRVYKYNPSKTVAQTNQSSAGFGPAGWDRLGADIDGEAVNDNSGISVSLSSDGITLAIGATGNDGNGNDSGHVRVYKFIS